MSIDQDRKWLVKTGGEIEGPWTFEELIRQLIGKKISLIDEVRDNESRWSFVREHQQLADIVRRLREQQLNLREDTLVTDTASTTAKILPDPANDTNTDTVTDSVGDELTPAPDFVIHPPKEVSTISSVTYEEHIPSKRVNDRSFSGVYVSRNDSNVRNQIEVESKKTLKWIWSIFALIIVIVAGTVYFTQFKTTTTNLSSAELLSRARQQRSIGLWSSSLDLYKRAEAKGELPPEAKLEMAPLLMFVDERNQEARRIFESSLKTMTINRAEEINMQIWIALSFLRDGQREQARVLLETLEKEYSGDPRILVNLAVIDILAGRALKAIDKINNLINRNIPEPRLLLMRGLATFLATLDRPDEKAIKSAISDLNGYLAKNLENRLEALLTKAALQSLIGSESQVELTVRELITQDPSFTSDHIHDFKIDWSLFDWRFFMPLCQRVENVNPNSAWSLGLKVFCLIQIDQKVQALKDIEFARNQYSGDLDLMGLQMWLLAEAGAESEARAIGYLDKKQQSHLVQLVFGNICLRDGDYSCSEERYNVILERSKGAVPAIYGLAVVYYERGKTALARDTAKEGLLVSPKYRPLVELKERVGAF